MVWKNPQTFVSVSKGIAVQYAIIIIGRYACQQVRVNLMLTIFNWIICDRDVIIISDWTIDYNLFNQ